MARPCATCGFAVPDGASRCPQCGRVFGEANRCPHCHAIAAVRPSGDGFVCTACGHERALSPGTTIVRAEGGKVQRRLMRLLGGLALAGAILGAAASTVTLGATPLGLSVAVVVGALGAAIGTRLLRGASERERALQDHDSASRTAKAKELLLERSSTVPELAARLGTSEAEADVIATRLAADEAHGISADLDEKEGVVRFGRRSVLPPVRIADPNADPDEGESESESADDTMRAQRRERR